MSNKRKRSNSRNKIPCTRQSIAKSQFDLPSNVDTITKIFITSSWNNYTFPYNCNFYGLQNGTDQKVLLASFFCENLPETITLLKEPFPVFMMPNWQFSFVIDPIFPYCNDIILSINVIIETINLSDEIITKKAKTLSSIINKPMGYTFTSKHLIKKANTPTAESATSFCFSPIGESPASFCFSPIASPLHKTIDCTVNTVSDLLDIIANNSPNENHVYSIDLGKLHKIKTPLEKINNLIGMNTIKESLVEFILYFISDLPKQGESQFMNIALQGSPGVGKTSISEIIAEILASIGAIKSSKIARTSGADLISSHVGGSEENTKKFLNANKGSVILLDEAYSIARGTRDDEFCMFGVKILDIINQFLGENTDTIMIICGYKDLLERYFFNVNRGLIRRFPWKFTIHDYTPAELTTILFQKIKGYGYTIEWSDAETAAITKIIAANKKEMKSNVGDILTIITKTISMHARNICRLKPDKIAIIHYNTLFAALNAYINTLPVDNDKPPDMWHI